ncbi:hypothetical protein [Paenibacillus methanolicus]|uniref:Uncharacterized protein n=1 Tax=Paenibacillus methanolicus TaxID=582686 RepID=A0A5S5CJS9_9BACL|nr:hypothetical protein [Paenibacillus methanolicus]TYP78253.1 hypothetical protein BCM02_102830 [Paenibacillus methanolicus]
MIVKQIQSNYHSYLSELKFALDPVINLMRSQHGRPWRGTAWMGPLKTFMGYMKHLKFIQAIKWASLPIIGPFLAGFAAGVYGPWSIWISAAGALLIAFGVYYLHVRSYMGKMATIGRPEFHVEAFKEMRPTEYEQTWAQFVHKNDFTFEGLYDIVNTVFSQNNHDPSSVAYVVAYSQSQHDYMQRTVEDLKRKIEEQQADMNSLNDLLVESDTSIADLVDLIKKINQNLYRYVNGCFNLHDMDFVTGFSLYRRAGDTLEPIMDKGTSGNKRPLDMKADTGYAAVLAAEDPQGKAHLNAPYEGREVIAFRMDMLDGESWVWCFHFDTDDKRALSLLKENDTIEAREIRRMVHAFCLVYQKSQLTLKEVAQDETA